MLRIIIAVTWIACFQSCAAQSADKPVLSSQVILTDPGEPGSPFVLKLELRDAETGKQIPGVEVFAYHTNAKGDYENNALGVARIHGKGITDAAGQIQFTSIYPRGYNDSPRGGHVHFKVKGKNFTLGLDRVDGEPRQPRAGQTYLIALKEEGERRIATAVLYVSA